MREVNMSVKKRLLRMQDVEKIKRGYVDKKKQILRVNGEDEIGIGIGMKKKGKMMEFGEEIEKMMDKVKEELKVGVKVLKVEEKKKVVKEEV